MRVTKLILGVGCALLLLWAIRLNAPKGAQVVEASNDSPATLETARDPQIEAAADLQAATQATPAKIITLQDLPAGAFRTSVEALQLSAQEKVLQKISERPQYLKDIASMRVDGQGMIYYVCKMEAQASVLASSGATDFFGQDVSQFTGTVPIGSEPAYHSRPGAEKVLYLDFNGEAVSGTAWNENPDYGQINQWDCLPYDTDGDPTSFSVYEQVDFYLAWLRVAEDYAPFDIDITTEEPAAWTSQTGHALITSHVDKNGVSCPHYDAGGLAYFDVFGESNYLKHSIVWVQYSSDPSIVADIISHEFGHNLGLAHDGIDATEYYTGHINGTMSWAPIMGTPYGMNMTQWSAGDYLHASNTTDDDIAVIGMNLGVLSDDFGNSKSAAEELLFESDGTFSESGSIGVDGDIDYFTFTLTSNAFIRIEANTLRLNSVTRGANLDVLLELMDASGEVITSANYELEVSAEVEANLTTGTYFIRVSPVGVGAPLSYPPTGYSTYGTLGRYTLDGSCASMPGEIGVAPLVTDSFESDLDDWIQPESDDLDWRRYYYTPTGSTGTQGGSDGNYFAYTEASDNVSYRMANLEKVFDLSLFESASLEFSYYMYGADMGSLSVDIFDDHWTNNVWKRIGEQQTQIYGDWRSVSIDLSEFSSKSGIKIRFRSYTGSTPLSDIAIDGITVSGVLLDMDGDGLPNAWERTYFGDATNALASAVSANGVNTLLESYIAGIDPSDASDQFRVSYNPETREVTWTSVEDRFYSLYWSSNLVDGFDTNPIEQGVELDQFIDEAHTNNAHGFYRVDVELSSE